MVKKIYEEFCHKTSTIALYSPPLYCAIVFNKKYKGIFMLKTDYYTDDDKVVKL